MSGYHREEEEGARGPVFQYVVLYMKGFCMGASDVVPGVSGGTMAFILGIYERLINAITSFDANSFGLLITFRMRAFFERVSWRFLLLLGAGILSAIFTLARVLSWLLVNEPVLIWSFFLGLIIASVVSVSRRVDQWSASRFVCLVLATWGSYCLVGLIPVATPDTPWFLFMCGAIAICAMILPGISGSFMLVLLGKYGTMLDAVNNRDFLILSIFAAGAGVGIAAFSRILGWLLKRYHDLMVAVLTGLMLGSLRKVWPWKTQGEPILDAHGAVVAHVQGNTLPNEMSGEVLCALGVMLAGLVLVLVLDRSAQQLK